LQLTIGGYVLAIAFKDRTVLVFDIDPEPLVLPVDIRAHLLAIRAVLAFACGITIIGLSPISVCPYAYQSRSAVINSAVTIGDRKENGMSSRWHRSRQPRLFDVAHPRQPRGGCPETYRARTLCLSCALLALVLLGSGCKGKNVSAATAPPPNVQVAGVVQQDVPVYHEWIATLDGFVNAQIQPQVSGYLIKQEYQEGTLVRKGQVLFKIDPRPFQAVLDQSKAQLAQAQAQLGKTELDVKRDTPLAKERAIAQSQLDNDIQANLAGQATVQAGKAAVEQAELNLEFTNVRSLIDGFAGIANGQVGNLVGPQTILTTVSRLDPIKVYFTVSEQQYLAFVQRNPTVAARAAREKELSLDLILADGTTYARKGKFYAVDRQVDVQTGAIRLAGLFPNPDNVLRPGQYGRVRFVSYIRPKALLVPQRAVIELQGNYLVAVVGNDNKVMLRPVKVGERAGPLWIVDEGLKPGERVVVEGVQKVRDGSVVSPTVVNTSTESR
jgi:RND family efflux transporter MFP subunit